MKLREIMDTCANNRFSSHHPIVNFPTGGPADWNLAIRGISYDSRTIGQGDLFFCIEGDIYDGHDFASDAVKAGAAAVVFNMRHAKWKHTKEWSELPVVTIAVEDVRLTMALIAESFFGYPSREITTVGITGTNGKTTTANLVADIAASAGETPAVIGTLTGERTTPEAPDLQRQIRELVDEGNSFLSMEVSSHALTQQRVSDIEYDVAVFTNLSVDHLDYHGDLETYFQVKSQLFTPKHAKQAVINVDDEFGQRLAEEVKIPHTNVSMEGVKILQETFKGTTFKWKDETITLSVPGSFNVENAVVAATVAQLLGFEKDAIVSGLSAAETLPGRFEVVDLNSGCPTVIVDYSHTPEGLRKVLESVRRIISREEFIVESDLHVVFGCGGERDISKRPIMAKVAEENASFVYLTSDNPRSENQMKIIDDVARGFSDIRKIHVDPDRRKSIFHAIQIAQPADVVVIAGKGSETMQEISGTFLPFNDKEVALEALEARNK